MLIYLFFLCQESNGSFSVVDLPPAAQDDFLTDSTRPRKKRRAIDQRLLLQAEDSMQTGEAPRIPRPVLVGVDCSFKSYLEYANDWINRWRSLELLYGPEWRSDKMVTVTSTDGSIVEEVKTNTRASWWNKRKPLYHFFEVSFGRSDSTFKDTIQAGEEIYQSCKTSEKQKRPSMKALEKAFKGKLQSMGELARSGGGRQPSIINDFVTEKLDTQTTSDPIDMTAPASFPGNDRDLGTDLDGGEGYDNRTFDDNSSFMAAFAMDNLTGDM